jgi:predicted phosphoadenosine phosphosulfate sulfurtransferase
MVAEIQAYIKEWEQKCYKKGIPDEVIPALKEKVPNYKQIALCILNNDHALKSLGFSTKQSKWYSYYKRIEIDQRRYAGKQLKLF